MWRPARFVDDNVAFSRMPARSEIGEVAETFDAVVVLVEEFELPYSLDEWRKRGVEVLHSPVRDFSAPDLGQLLEILRWIEARVAGGKKVLIHCMGGLGRSGTVAVAWLMYSKGLPLREALRRVRSLRPGVVEVEEQMGVLKELERLLRSR
ncbi:protein-tyrosine phosphatase family protein [Thermococcus thioreducens]|uniref:Protein tyrosine phosphatase n=1 Tax=Thermococcus thioreducens TaxID=277988 RepID=A0A0Q2S1R1_9EURY|nr:dual specificity protein phosphatase family protein [Thermococcus thioreducens]ASJ12978.1 protein tyrosine phosphatase [Thermococcus thioreducens]KQH81475.1 protein tyrosine phosphatase [Thermococcus thioreducens]SEV82689.1 protein tyrosine phosphatase [Thermococcus thioreducens]